MDCRPTAGVTNALRVTVLPANPISVGTGEVSQES
jgi:hypothetical protein